MTERTELLIKRRKRATSTSRRGGALGVVVLVLLAVGLIAGGVYWYKGRNKATKNESLIFAAVERGTFVHEVNGKGSAESAKNTDVASQVEGNATVIYLIPEGTDVKKGELLVELDSSSVDEKLDSQVVTTNTSRATLNSSRATLRSAEISLEEYVEGTFESSWLDYENEVFSQEQTRKQQADTTRFTERLLNMGYSTELQFEVDKVAEEKAKNSLAVANLKKLTLLKYTSEKQITSLMSDIETARAKVDSDKNSYNINLNRENRYRAQSANCKIKAPQDGQVVYANQDSRRMSEADMIKEGSTVRQRQVLIRLPDKGQMQVKTMINESNISSVKVGMPAKITFDSLPNRVIEGEVVKVNQYPEIVWMSSAKDYVTLVKIKDPTEELRTGLTAQVRIIADEQPDVLMVPVQCVTEYGKKTYCITYNEGVWGYKEVLLGASNEKQVIILDGLEEGERVVSGARLYREKVAFPDPSEPSAFENSEIYQAKLADAKAKEEASLAAEAEGVGKGDGMPGAGMGGAPGGMGAGMGGGRMGGGSRGGMPFGDPQAMLAQAREKYKSGELTDEMLSAMPAEIAAMIKGEGGSASLSGDELEAQQKKEEEAKEYASTIEAKLLHDAKVASLQPFFSRTVMEMHRELLEALSKKLSALQARIASRQNEIMRRQDDIEILKKIGTEENSEENQAKIDELIEEIKLLRGESDAEYSDRIVYYDLIDWGKYSNKNDITREGIEFLTSDDDVIFGSLFPNSTSLDEAESDDSASEEEDVLDLDVQENLGAQEDVDGLSDVVKTEVDGKAYLPFLPLFDEWDADQNDALKPTEFVIGFFSDRKSFQDSETDPEIDGFFEEYLPKESDEKDEFSIEGADSTIAKILSERENPEDGKAERRGGGFGRFRGGRPGGMPGMGGTPGAMPGMGGAPTGPNAPESLKPQDRPKTDDATSIAEGDKGGEKGKEDAPKDAPLIVEPPKPIASLAEATSLRQAIALFVPKMDFNGDGMIQKPEFVKGCHEIKDVAGKMFASTSALGSDGGFGGPSF